LRPGELGRSELRPYMTEPTVRWSALKHYS